MFVKSTNTVSGFYGGSNTPCNVFIAHCSNGLNVETLLDVNCFICAIGIDSEKTLERALEA